MCVFMARNYSRELSETLAFDNYSEKRPAGPFSGLDVAGLFSGCHPYWRANGSRGVTRVNTLELIEEISTVNQVVELHRFRGNDVGLRNRSLRFLRLFDV